MPHNSMKRQPINLTQINDTCLLVSVIWILLTSPLSFPKAEFIFLAFRESMMVR